MIVELNDGTFRSEMGIIAFRNKQTYRFPIATLLRLGDNNHPAFMSLHKVRKRIVELQQSIQHQEQAIAAEAAMIYVSGDFQQLNDEKWRSAHETLVNSQRLLGKTQVEPYRRWSMGFACFCFVLVGAPWAIWSRRTDIVTNIFICAGPILILFAAFFSIGLNLSKHCHLPPCGVCLGNVVLLALGLFFLWKAARN